MVCLEISCDCINGKFVVELKSRRKHSKNQHVSRKRFMSYISSMYGMSLVLAAQICSLCTLNASLNSPYARSIYPIHKLPLIDTDLKETHQSTISKAKSS